MQRKRSPIGRRIGAAALAVLGAAVFAGSAQAALTVTGPIHPVLGFPAWYQDANGTQLELCVNDPGCPVSPPVLEPVAPNDEAFYSLVGADLTGPAGQSVTMEFAIEAAFLDTPVTFGRVQVTMSGMVPNSDYTFTYPYGTSVWTTDAGGNMLGGFRAAARHEVGCFTGFATPCDTTLGTEIGPFISWDPAVQAPPAGYIGDGLTAQPIVGTATNFVRVTGPGLPPGGISTNLFTVEGKLAGPAVPIFFAAPGSGEFGTQRVASTTTRTITVKNNGLAAMPAFTGASIQGADAGSFATRADSCTGVALASGQSCTVDVSFAPGASGAKSASLVLAGGTAAGNSVPLAGVGGLPGVATDPGVVNFFNQPVGTTSPELQLTVRNTGPVALNISKASIAGPNAAEFGVPSNTCTAAVAPGSACKIGLRFLPGANGTRNASLVLEDDGDGSPHVVPLTGAGTGARSTGSTGTGNSSAKLALGRLTLQRKVSRSSLRRSGLRASLTLPKGTEVLRVRLYRAGAKKKLVTSFYRFPTKDGAYRLVVRSKSVRALRPGRYVLEVTPGRSKRSLGVAKRVAFQVR